ncbi:helix-turn-helix domain-containing protein [Halorarius halobius]|uniref:helix-turn-helix domain-containing protein n=1 Tax=Halorarius halobius TaxID=2962671 RepID=UPI0020CFA870|nr:helix-turn-helix domain-containing protein [Halorarius halobius]
MRYVKVFLSPEDGDLHPAADDLAEHPDVTRESIQHLNLLNDGTAVTLSRLRGDRASLEEILGGTDDIMRYDVSEAGEELQAYIHFVPNATTHALMELTREHELVLDTPIEYNPDGSIRVSVIGQDDVVQNAIEHVPDNVRLELEQLSDYDPELRELSSLLTERQREILDAAVEVGYYKVPRNATHEDIAERVDISTTTVGEHLRKIEARLLSEIAR